MRFRSLCHCLVSGLTIASWCPVALAERSAANFPEEPRADSGHDTPARSLAPVPATPREAERIAPARSAPALRVSSAAIERTTPERKDSDRQADERRRKEWMLSLEGVTHAPVDMGVQVGLETPQGLRIFAGYGWVPGTYMNLLTGVAANASGNSYAQALLEHAQYRGQTWRVQGGFRPFRAIGLYGDVGYAHVGASGALDLASSGVPQLAIFGGGYQARTSIDMWLIELGYEGELADRLVMALALGMMGTLGASTTIESVGGAPTNSAILNSAANQADAALRKYGFVPTLTLRLGFDLI